MKKIVECVPNFSEGRNAGTIKSIAESIHGVENVKLLNVEPDKDYNRVVVTFIGEPEGVAEAAFQSTKTASYSSTWSATTESTRGSAQRTLFRLFRSQG